MNHIVRRTICTAAAVSLMAGAAYAQNQSFGQVEPANKVYGKQVMSSDNQKIGNLNNLIIDLESGHILYATLAADKGRIAVPPQIFTKTPGPNDKTVQVNVPKQKIEGAPQFGNWDKPEELGQAQFISQVYQYFGQNAWWQGAQAANVGTFHNVHKASEAIGMNVLDVKNAGLGKVNNVMVDLPNGRVAYLILTPNPSFNLGNNLYALPPDAFTLSADHKNLVSGIDQAKLAGAPHFDKNNWAQLSDPSYASQVYSYYGKQAYFNTSNLRPTGR